MLSPMLPRGRWAEGKPVVLAVQMTGQELDSFLLPPSPGFLSHLPPFWGFYFQQPEGQGRKEQRTSGGSVGGGTKRLCLSMERALQPET